jgi:hypothetical protein
MKDKIDIPPMEEVIKHNPSISDDNNDKNNEENNEKDLKEDNAKDESDEEVEGGRTGEYEVVPNIPPIPPLPTSGNSVEDEDDDEEQKKRRGRPKTIHAKTACAKSMLVILNKLKKIHSKSLQSEVKELAEDAMTELNHLHEIINKVL